jgi:hypothetical protein
LAHLRPHPNGPAGVRLLGNCGHYCLAHAYGWIIVMASADPAIEPLVGVFAAVFRIVMC